MLFKVYQIKLFYCPKVRLHDFYTQLYFSGLSYKIWNFGLCNLKN